MNGKLKKTHISSIPYVFIGLFATKLGQAWRLTSGNELGEKILNFGDGFREVIRSPFPSFQHFDLLIGAAFAVIIRLFVYEKSKTAKKYRRNEEYGSARWSRISLMILQLSGLQKLIRCVRSFICLCSRAAIIRSNA